MENNKKTSIDYNELKTETLEPREFVLGNPELPIADYHNQIINSVHENQAVIITAETGAGKSTQVPQFLAEAGYKVIVTQPRVVAARTVAERVSEEIQSSVGNKYDNFVGYRTAHDRNDNLENQILYATDGLQLVRELSGSGVTGKQVLILDEIHEWNENMEVLVAWSKQRMAEDPDFKVVMMSATMDAENLSEYLSDNEDKKIPIIEVPGRTFEVNKSEGGNLVDKSIELAKQGKNTLVFVPGKAEINDVIARLEKANIPDAVVLPLHGQLEPDEQRKVFRKYQGTKIIIATNVAQTSVTIDDIDAVVDSGLERRSEVKNGVEGLYLRPVSKADCLQRAGRAGRTRDGEYILAQLGNNKPIPLDAREPYATPEILRTRLDSTVLRLAKNGFDASKLDFYHQPDINDINDAKERLHKLGALDDNGDVTTIGKQMERMPIESHYARMMIEARKYGPELQNQLAALLAIQEIGGISFRGRNSEQRWKELVTKDYQSDSIIELEVFIAAQKMSIKEQKNYDIMTKAMGKAHDVFRQLRHAEKIKDNDLIMPDINQRDQLAECIVSGMVDNIYIDSNSGYVGPDNDIRSLSDRSMANRSKLGVGDPFDLQIQSHRGPVVLKLLQNVTAVSVDMLKKFAPGSFTLGDELNYSLNLDDIVVKNCNVLFNGIEIDETLTVEAEPSKRRQDCLVNYFENNECPATENVEKIRIELMSLVARAPSLDLLPKSINSTKIAHTHDFLKYTMPLSVGSIDNASAALLEIRLDDFISNNEVMKIEEASPLSVGINGIKFDLKYRPQRPGRPIIENWKTFDEKCMNLPDTIQLPDGRDLYCEGNFNYEISCNARRREIIQEERRRSKLEA